MNDIYIKIDGGIGRVIAATGAVEEFAKRKAEEGIKVNVVSSFPQLFNGLEYINRIYRIDMPYLYEDYISKGEFLEPEPYNHILYYKENKHLATVFNVLLNGVDEFIAPKIILTENEVAEAKTAIGELRSKNGGKKIMVIQPWGSQGGVPQSDGTVLMDESFRSFTLDFAKDLVKEYKDEYQILSVQSAVQRGEQQVPQYVLADTMPSMNPDVRKVIAILQHVDAIITCDSFIFHASYALGINVPTIVLWGGTNSQNLGYDNHTNIVTAKDVIFEPNRVPHDHTLYLNHNRGCNNFDIKKVKKGFDLLTKKVIKD